MQFIWKAAIEGRCIAHTAGYWDLVKKWYALNTWKTPIPPAPLIQQHIWSGKSCLHSRNPESGPGIKMDALCPSKASAHIAVICWDASLLAAGGGSNNCRCILYTIHCTSATLKKISTLGRNLNWHPAPLLVFHVQEFLFFCTEVVTIRWVLTCRLKFNSCSHRIFNLVSVRPKCL